MKRVLVVDDESSILDLMEVFFEDEGYEVLTAHDGVAGLEALVEVSVDLVITDTMMPKRGGVELVRSMREQSELRDIPVIVMSAATRPDLDGLGPATFLANPFDLFALLDTFAAALCNPHRAIGPESYPPGRDPSLQ